MRIVSTLALGLALSGVVASAPAFAQKKDKKEEAAAAKYTPAVQKALVGAQEALKKNDAAGALAKVAEAKAAGLQTADDKNATGSIEYQVYQINKDQTLLADAVELMLSSGKAGANAGQLYTVQAQIAYQAKDFAKAATAATEALKAGATDPNLVPILVTAQSNQGQALQALNSLNENIDRATAAGQTVPVEWFQRGVAIGYQAKSPTDAAAISEATSAITRKWVAAYPTKQNWNDAITTYLSQYKPATDVQVDAFRLLRRVGALMSDGHYREYAADIYLRFPGETVAVLEEGSQKGVVNLTGKNDATDLLGIVKPKVAADKASLAASDKSARAAANGNSALTTADAYVGYGMYPQAIDLYKVALAKGADAGTVNLHMGWAMAMAGDAAGAKTAFQQVTGVRKPLADFWLVHLDHPTTA